MAKLTRKLPLYAPAMQIKHHPALSVTQEDIGMRLLKQVGIDTLGDLYTHGIFMDSNDLAYISNPTLLFKFTYYRLQGAIKKFYPTYPREPPQFTTLQRLITEPRSTHLVSKLYTQLQEEIGANNQKTLDRWNNILDDPLTKEEWQTCGIMTSMLMPNGNLQLLYYKYLHQTYHTPARLYKHGLRSDARCQRCGAENADFLHLAWSCVSINIYWEKVIKTLSDIVEASIEYTMRTCLLGLIPTIRATKCKFCTIALLLAKRRISIHWGSKKTPQIKQWFTDMTYCKDRVKTYEEELPSSSKPKDYWKYLTDYLKSHPTV